MTTAAVPVVVGLGSNVGDRVAQLQAAFRALDALPDTRVLQTSRLYRTPAWGVTEQPEFLNAAALLSTALPPRALLEALLAIERDAGRDRSSDRMRWGPRTLDLDLLLYGEYTIDEPGLHVPHPHLHERAFALVPLLEVWPGAAIPGRGAARDALSALAAMAAIDVEALG
ncbi:MAG TPA: 2-amino-4-hydroxy-6-hydroxymethyldihydropteridine diphosphokinase [Lysobacter sp.]|nr:2-amino-4-hydroxy-6-hydroxymethyldihydropteridine diphosphokinase [Lysobacter sp.]